VLIASLTATLVAGIQTNPAVPESVRQQASTELSAGVPFLSDTDAEEELKAAGLSDSAAAAIIDENSAARLDALRAALAVIALVAAMALFFAGAIPTRQPGAKPEGERAPPVAA